MKSSITRVERRHLKDQIVEQLVSMILNGKLKQGDKLPPEHVLMKQFGVGRGSLREAIGALSLMGVLTVRPGHGTHVAYSPDGFITKPLSWGLMMAGREKVHELVEARTVLEQAIVGLAAQRATDEDIAEMRHHHAQLKAAKKAGRKAVQADLSFHTALAKASHNDILVRLLIGMRHLIRTWMEQKATAVGGYDLVKEEHEEILRAIEAHDVERAQSALRNHLDSVGERLARILISGKG